MLPGPGAAGNIAPPPSRSRAIRPVRRTSEDQPQDVETANSGRPPLRNRAFSNTRANDEDPEDVESARESDVEPLGTPPRTPSSGSKEPSLADVESASLTDVETQSSRGTEVDPLEDRERALVATEQVLAQRWICDLCCEPHAHHDTPWRLGDGCDHSLCRRCLRGCVQWGGRCPYDNTPIPPIVICGAMATEEYVYHEKHAEAMRTGGIMCTVADCPGVAPSESAAPRRAVACNCCVTLHCSRKICGAPWSTGHRCWDIVEAERRDAELRSAAQVGPRSCSSASFSSPFSATKQRLVKGPRFRPCPCCGVMVEHDGGCNMVYHDSCGTRWCFVCRRIGTCTEFNCRAAPSSGPPTPRLTPRPDASQSSEVRRSTLQLADPIGTPRVPQKPRKVILMLFAVPVILAVALYACVGLPVGTPKSSFLDLSTASATLQQLRSDLAAAPRSLLSSASTHLDTAGAAEDSASSIEDIPETQSAFSNSEGNPSDISELNITPRIADSLQTSEQSENGGNSEFAKLAASTVGPLANFDDILITVSKEEAAPSTVTTVSTCKSGSSDCISTVAAESSTAEMALVHIDASQQEPSARVSTTEPSQFTAQATVAPQAIEEAAIAHERKVDTAPGAVIDQKQLPPAAPNKNMTSDVPDAAVKQELIVRPDAAALKTAEAVFLSNINAEPAAQDSVPPSERLQPEVFNEGTKNDAPDTSVEQELSVRPDSPAEKVAEVGGITWLEAPSETKLSSGPDRMVSTSATADRTQVDARNPVDKAEIDENSMAERLRIAKENLKELDKQRAEVEAKHREQQAAIGELEQLHATARLKPDPGSDSDLRSVDVSASPQPPVQAKDL